MFVSFQSAISILGNTAEMYMHGIQWVVWVPVSKVLANLLTERFIITWLYPLKLVSVNDVSVVLYRYVQFIMSVDSSIVSM